MFRPRTRFVRIEGNAGDVSIISEVACAHELECASCGGDAARHLYQLTTRDVRRYAYGLCDRCHTNMAFSTGSPRSGRREPASGSGAESLGAACGPIAAAVDDALARFVAAGEPRTWRNPAS
jgi:hypothetical protein